MLKIPIGSIEAVEMLNALYRLNQTNDDFKRVRKWLEGERERLSASNSKAVENHLYRWQQGGIQILNSLKQIIDNSRETSIEIEEKLRAEV